MKDIQKSAIFYLTAVVIATASPSLAQGGGGGAGQTSRDLERGIERVNSPVVQVLSGEAEVRAKDAALAKAKAEAETKVAESRSMAELGSIREAAAKKARENEAIGKLRFERKGIADQAEAEAVAAKVSLDKAIRESKAAGLSAEAGVDSVEKLKRILKSAADTDEDAKTDLVKAKKRVDSALADQTDAEKVLVTAKGEKAVVAGKAGLENAKKQVMAVKEAYAKAIAAAEVAAAKKSAVAKELEASVKNLAELKATKERTQAAEVFAAKTYDAANEKCMAAAKSLSYSERDARVKLAADERAALAKAKSEKEKAAEALALEAASGAAEKAQFVAKGEKDAADKAVGAAKAKHETIKSVSIKADEAQKNAASAVTAALAASKAARDKLSQTELMNKEAAKAKARAVSETASATESLADAKSQVSKASMAMDAAKAGVIKDAKDQKALAAKASAVSAAETRLAGAKSAEAKAAESVQAAKAAEVVKMNDAVAKEKDLLAAKAAATQSDTALEKAKEDERTYSAAARRALQDLDRAARELKDATAVADDKAVRFAAAETQMKEASAALDRVAKVTKRQPAGEEKPALQDGQFISVKDDDYEWFCTAKAEDGRTLRSCFKDQIAYKGKTLEEAAAAVQAMAVSSGFYLASITVEDGKVFIDKGRFGDIGVLFKDSRKDGYEGTWFSRKQIKQKLTRNGIREGGVFNYAALYESFKDLSSHPDLEVDLKLTYDKEKLSGDGGAKPGAEPRDLRVLGVDMLMKESVPLHGVFGIDNYGTSSYDEWVGRGTLQWLNLTGVDDAITVNANTALTDPAAMYGVAGSYYRPVIFDAGAKGPFSEGALTFHGGYTEVDTEDVVPEIDVEGTGWFAGMQASVRLLDNNMHRLDLSAGLTFRNVESGLIVQGNRMDEKNEVTVVPLSLALMYTGKGLDGWNGRNYFTIEGVYNKVGAMGASDAEEMQLQRAEANEDFYLIGRAQAARVQLLNFGDVKGSKKNWMLFTRLEGQFANDPLIPAEQMGVGGHASVRGYEEREFLGDHGVTGTLELRTPIGIGLIDQKHDEGRIGWDRTQLVVFFDFGYFELDEALGKGEDDSEFLCSIGPGIRTSISKNLQLRFDWGFPLEETAESSGSGRMHFGIQGQF